MHDISDYERTMVAACHHFYKTSKYPYPCLETVHHLHRENWCSVQNAFSIDSSRRACTSNAERAAMNSEIAKLECYLRIDESSIKLQVIRESAVDSNLTCFPIVCGISAIEQGIINRNM
jgi:hypothetical protein